MNLKSKPLLLGLALAVIAGTIHLGFATSAQDRYKGIEKKSQKTKQTKLQKLMRGKLDAANKILEGLTTEDFELVGKGSDALTKISSHEAWRVSNDTMYRQQSIEFQSMVKRLSRAAKDEKLDTAALAYVQVTISCIDCHKWVRAVLIADNEKANATTPVDLDRALDGIRTTNAH